MENKDEYYMHLALKEAKKAYQMGEIPVGCVIVLNDEVIAKSHNTRHQNKSVLDHAEIIAIKKAEKKTKSWMLDNATIYVTLEPCLMCAGTILQSRIKRVVYAAKEPKFGVLGSVMNVFENNSFCHKFEVTSGILEGDSALLLQSFFKELRRKKREEKA